MSKTTSLGNTLRGLDTAAWLEAESTDNQAARFSKVDELVEWALDTSLAGTKIVEFGRDDRRNPVVSVVGLPGSLRRFVDERYLLKSQQERGAWFMPEEANMRAGLMNLGFAFKEFGKFASEALFGTRSRGKASLHTPDALMIWALLEPLFSIFAIPFELRGPRVGARPPEDQRKLWTQFDSLCSDLGVDVADALGPMAYRGGWHKLRAAEQLEAKQNLLEALRDRVPPGVGSRYRVHRLRALLIRYYKASDDEGRALRKKALPNALEPTLAGYFGGDWLELLEYVGEPAHPAEEIAAALPKTRVYVGASKKVDEVAAVHGVPAAEVEKMLAAFWKRPDASSPVEERIDVLKQYWTAFARVHDAQRPGMPSLWGFVDESYLTFSEAFGESPQYDLSRHLLPQDLVKKVETLWGSLMLKRFPDRIVGAPFPHALMATAFGPALKLWHEIALTGWFFCEGPRSVTDLAGLKSRHRDQLHMLNDLGTPITPQLFDELNRIQKELPEPKTIYEDVGTQEVAPGMSVTISTGGFATQRPGGFARVQAAIARFRSEWANEHLETYLRARWEGDIKGAARDFYMMREDKGRVPTPKQFAKHAVEATNHWFGGDISGFYGAIGEKSPVAPIRQGWFPEDRLTFMWSVYCAMGGRPFGNQPSGDRSPIDMSKLAAKSLDYVQLEQALGRPPTLKDFGASRFQWDSKTLSDDIDKAWDTFARAIEEAKQHPVAFPGWPTKKERSGVMGASVALKSEMHDSSSGQQKKSLWDRIRSR